jgi:tetratricopeptide (TPR) repeat protein
MDMGSPEGPNTERGSNESLFERSDLGNVAQAARSHYHAGQRELQTAEKLARKAAEATDEERRATALGRRTEHLEKAASEFLEAIGFDKSLVDAYVGLGEAYSELGKHEEALQVHAQALALDPQSDASFAGWVDELLALNRLGDAAAAYDAYAATQPERAQVVLAGMRAWYAAKQQDPGDVSPEAIARMADWLAQHGAGG